jgi:trehalose-phosphatase
MNSPLLVELRSRFAKADERPSLSLFLDFDGTLTPLVDRPELASLPPDTHRVLTALAAKPQVTVAVISGRALADLCPRVGVPGLIYAGNHGLEISAADISFVEPTAAARREALHQLSERLIARLGRLAGVQVEHKGLTTAIHVRRASPAAARYIERVLQHMVPAPHPLFRVTTGIKTYEVRPRVDWNKGSAVRWIREHLDLPDALPIYLGDDLTDEDAFAVLTDGITVKVGPFENTCARYHLAGPTAVEHLLVWLDHAVSQPIHHLKMATTR